MEIELIADVILIVFVFLIIIYNFVVTSGTECFDRFSVIMSLFALIYSIFLRII